MSDDNHLIPINLSIDTRTKTDYKNRKQSRVNMLNYYHVIVAALVDRKYSSAKFRNCALFYQALIAGLK